MNSNLGLPSLEAGQARANLGLPVPAAARFRLLKRAIYKVNWMFLQHQVAFNNDVLEAIHELSLRQEQWFRRTEARIELALRQVTQEVGDHIATSEAALTAMQLRLAQLSSDLRKSSVQGRNHRLPSNSASDESDT